MSTRDRATFIFERLSEEQLEAFVTLFGRTFIPEEEPDEWDREMIERSKKDNSESVPLEQVAAEMGFNLDDL